MIAKQIHGQDAYYKLSAKNSGETSLNLSNELLRFIAPDLEKGSERSVSFELNREDYLKALGYMFNISPLFTSTSNNSTQVDGDPAVFAKDFMAVCDFFGSDEKKIYTVNMLYKSDGRIYLNSLEDKDSKFNIRHFLVEDNSTLVFEKTGDTINITLKSGHFSHKIREKGVNAFAKEVCLFFSKFDGLSQFLPYFKESQAGYIQLENQGITLSRFLNPNIDKSLKGNRWFEDEFVIAEKHYLLCSEWTENKNKNSVPSLEDFNEIIRYAYNGRFAISKEDGFFILKDTLLSTDSSSNTDSNSQSLPLQRILYGAPGTGKSFSIKKTIAEHNGVELDMEDKRIFRTTFHPDYDYAQFVGCYKPTKEDSEKLTIDYKFLLDKLSEFTNNYNQTTSAFLLGLEYRSELDRVLQAEHKTYNDLFKDAGCQSTNLPTMLTAGITANDRNRVLKSQITYSFTPQVFTNALVKAYENPTENVYLVIEEINRGNCAQIFGDIFQLLDRNGNGESEYTINVDEDLKKYLEENCPAAINDGKIKLPSNFNIIATMNTSDQSLFPMDSAFKRRWEWEYVKVDYKNEVSGKYTIKVDDKTYNWHTFMKAVNAKIKDVTSSEDKQMGNFFIKGDVDAKAFCNKVMFYLWNDVSKDYYGSNDSLFQYIEEDSKPAKHFSFNELFGENQTKLLHGFMKFVKCNPISKKESDGSDSVQSASEDSNNSQEA